MPNLEIETGDILGAGHASATGRFDDEQLFYLQSRGITEDEARRLVVRGFLSEIVSQIGCAGPPGTASPGDRSRAERAADRRVRERGDPNLRSDELVENQAVRVVVDGVPDRACPATLRATYTRSATPARTARSRSRKASSRARPSNAGPTARKFSLITGKPLNLPAYEPVPVYQVDLVDGDIYLDPNVTKEI